MTSLVGNLINGLRLACFRTVKLADVEVSWRAVWAVLACMAILLETVDFYYVRAPRLFEVTGFTNVIAIFSCVFMASSLVTMALRDQGKLLVLAVLLFNGFLLPWAVYMGVYAFLDDWIEERDLNNDLKVIFCCWWFFVALRAVVLVFPDWPARQLPAAAFLVAALYVPVHFFPSYFWRHDYHADRDDAPIRISAEEMLQSQHVLLARKLKEINQTSVGKPGIYGIIFGGTGYQDVFLKESQFVDGVLTKQFGMAHRTVVMVNNDKTVRDIPMATATNLGDALNDIDHKMRNADDIALVYLTSHGSVESGVSVQMNNTYGLRDVAPKLLADLLRQSGIRNKIVIVSACHSGVMIEPLKGPDTLVITASAKDRTSFGCSNEADLTYFADAYFKQALPQTKNFITAFYLARHLIEVREKKEGIDPSKPQIFVGEHIKALLTKHGMLSDDKKISALSALSK